MKIQPTLLPFLLIVPVLIPTGAGGAPVQVVGADSIPGILLSTALANLSVSLIAILILIGGLYAYASLARFAPYHTWIYLYLVSLTGIVWALFLVDSGGFVPESVFVLSTVIGLNLIVHILRFDRIEMPFPLHGKSAGIQLE